MDVGTVIGIVVALVGVGLSIVIGGGNPMAFFDIASISVVIGGTSGAIIMCFPLEKVLKTHTIAMKAFFGKAPDAAVVITDLVRYAEVARREGILSLENLIGEMKDPFIVRGVKMAVDGTDPELIKSVMDTELESMFDRHIEGKLILDTIGKFAPAFGMIGTLMGLIFMLQNMDDPSAIGPGMAVALITTLYGAVIANCIVGPLGEKLAARNAEEVMIKTLIITGVMSIQSGDNPRVVESRLLTFLPPSKRDAIAAVKAA